VTAPKPVSSFQERLESLERRAPLGVDALEVVARVGQPVASWLYSSPGSRARHSAALASVTG